MKIEELRAKRKEVFEEYYKINELLRAVSSIQMDFRLNANLTDICTCVIDEEKVAMYQAKRDAKVKEHAELQRQIDFLENAEELAWLDSDFCKEWLEKMRFTTRQEGDQKYIFLSILPGFQKMDNSDFQRMCDALCLREFGRELRMDMWIGGKVDWTMFYERPNRVNGSETYFCGIVAKDDFSPEDWDKNHDDFWFDERGYQRSFNFNERK